MRMLAWLGGLLILATGGALLFLYLGLYNVAATDRHTPAVTWIFRTALENWVHRHAGGIAVPPSVDLRDPALAEQAFGHYNGACVLCHGGPGVKPAPWMEINPAAPDLVQAGPRWSDAELFWIVKNGIKMTGMPALGRRTATTTGP